MKDKIKTLVDKVLKKPIKSALTLGLAGLVTLTALKDNVHFGSVHLYNPQGNHYVWGLIPDAVIIGKETKGDIYTIGILITNRVHSDKHEGNLNAYGLLSGNFLKNGTIFTGDINTYGIGVRTIDGFRLGKNAHLGLKDYIVKGDEGEQ